MRTTLACQWCRKSKLKCHHNGSPPCKACASHAERECVLTTPQVVRRHPKPRSASRHRYLERPGYIEQTPDNTNDVEPQDFTPRSSRSTNPVTTVDREIIRRACQIFTQKFPEFGFLHKPTFLEHIHADSVSSLKLCAVMGLCARYLPEMTTRYGSALGASEHFAEYVRKNIMERVTSHADIDIIQTLVLLGLHDWGCCNGFRAWMYIGIAIRMAQMLQAHLKDDAKPGKGQMSVVLRESIHRTIWACFVIDCMLGCGRHRPRSFEAEKIEIPLPMNEEDYIFGSDASVDPIYLTSDSGSFQPAQKLGIEYCLSLTVQGFDIWSRLSRWICAGGRRSKLPTSSNLPWNETSFWNQTMRALENWRATLSPRLIYSSSGLNMQAHISRTQGESFAIINLLYYTMVIYLQREYIPFLPHRVSSPCGPINSPLLEEPAPPGWWEQGSRDLFNSASSIIQIIRGLQQHGIQLQTPFTSFCVFTAATTLSYASAWPHMAPGTEDARDMYVWGLEWLKESCKLWKIVVGWCDTMQNVDALYTCLKKESLRFPHIGREPFVELEDSIQRFAETEPGGLPAANILLALSQTSQLEPREERQGVSSRPRQTDSHEQGNQHGSADSEAGLGIADQNPFEYTSRDFVASQDLIASMMGEGVGLDWFQELPW
ncbi:Transcription factorfungi [Penicillium lividum]|nr:Transcription factorfungi [Penicillium lividum]